MPKTALVLSGGASLGAVQVGMLEVLAGDGVEPDMVVGTSVDAVNGAWIPGEAGLGNVAGLAEVWRSLRREDVFPLHALRGLLGFIGRRPSLLDAHGLRRLLGRHLRFERIEEAAVPLHVVATGVLDADDVRLSSGNAVDAITASASIPGVFPPVIIDGTALMDGGVVNNTPISHAVAFAAERILVLPTGYSCDLPEPPAGALAIALHALTVLVQHRLAVDIERYEGVVDLRVVPPLCPVTVSPADFSQTADLIDRAHSETTAWLAEPGPRRAGQAELVRPHEHH